MSTDLLLALAAFAFVSSVTPGPNNLMLLASGANFGFRRTIPHMLGIAIGFVVMIVLVGIGLMGIFQAVPWSKTVLEIVSVAYLLWLAWKIANAAPPSAEAQARAKPMTFLQAAAFQWVNPKAWTMALSAIAIYAPDRTLQSIVVVALLFEFAGMPAITLWTALGQQMRKILTNPARLRAFNIAMALLLVASLWPVVAPHIRS